ncbi:membrane protease YdiL (CAAX protease family) [Salibacterium salarium]|uniref:CPBP family intramembrane glutamic endopeptidase n=1 Tax=Salibacterium salarium TaxID=284579 RepID=UPI002785FA9F|nr:type II CAAX endopeptidase family protein [Salibacterium salarium]MDQ0300425.1 membrane protease YdiL (CAAX protease family) [Salibacterium salarium]
MNIRYWLILIVYLLMQLSGPIVIELGWIQEESIFVWTMGSFFVALILFSLLIYPERRLSGHPRLSKTSAGYSIKWTVFGVFMVFIAQYIAILIEKYALGIEPGSQNTEDILSIVKAIPFFAFIVAIIGPILEEIVFRKVIFGAFYKRFNFVISALLSALIFSVVHFDFTHILIYTAVGFTFSYLYVKTGRIIVPIVAHVAMNSYAVLINVLLGDKLQELQEDLEQLNFILGGLVL